MNEENEAIELTSAAEDPAVAEDGRDDEFDYDADGNIIIPDVEFDDPDDAHDADSDAHDDEEDDTDAENGGGVPTETETEEEKENAPKIPENDPRDARIAELQKLLEQSDRKNKRMESQAKDLLDALGIKDADTMHGLAKIVADSQEKDVDEYIRERDKKATDAELISALRMSQFAEKKRRDLEDVQKYYPETAKCKDISEIGNFKRFCDLRDSGYSAKDAYGMANYETVTKRAAENAKRQSLAGTKDHIRSSVPKPVSGEEDFHMTNKELRDAREWFPDLSDAEIKKLYKQL